MFGGGGVLGFGSLGFGALRVRVWGLGCGFGA